MIGDVTAIAWLVGAIGMAYMWVKICKSAEDDVDETYKRRLKRWFLRESNEGDEPPNWAGNFITLYDHTFGTRPWSLNFFLRSCLATTIFAALMILVYWGAGRISENTYSAFVNTPFAASEWQRLQWLLIIFVGNLFIDYLSLVETRWVLGKIEEGSKALGVVWIFADIVFTFAIFFMVSHFLYAFEQIWQSSFSFIEHLGSRLGFLGGGFSLANLGTVLSSVIRALLDGDGLGQLYSDGYRIGLITTYFTSIWIWLFVLSGVFSRLFLVFRGSITRLGRVFRVQDKPVTAVGYVLAILTLVAHLVIYMGVSAHAAITEVAPPAVEAGE